MKKFALIMALTSFAVLTLLSSCSPRRSYTCNCLIIINGDKRPSKSERWIDVEKSTAKPLCNDLQELAQRQATIIGGSAGIGKCELYE